MIRKILLLGMIGLLMIAGCGEKKMAFEEKAKRASEPRAALAPAEMAFNKSKPLQEGQSKRYIAVRYHFTVETSEAGLEKAWESMIGFCESIHCDIMESTINKKTPYSAPSGNLVLRVLPENLKPLVEHIHKVGKVVSQNTGSEDKTTTVIDVEAKIKNTTELRNRLRSIMTSRTGSLKDVVEVERELSKAQSELDTLVASRKALANETEKIAVSIRFSTRTLHCRNGGLCTDRVRMASDGSCIRRKHRSDPYFYRCGHPLVGPDHSGRLVSTQIFQETFQKERTTGMRSGNDHKIISFFN